MSNLIFFFCFYIKDKHLFKCLEQHKQFKLTLFCCWVIEDLSQLSKCTVIPPLFGSDVNSSTVNIDNHFTIKVDKTVILCRILVLVSCHLVMN